MKSQDTAKAVRYVKGETSRTAFFGGCILSRFYIKPQRRSFGCCLLIGCILFCFYIKPQRPAVYCLKNSVLRVIPVLKNTPEAATKSI